MQDFDRNVPLEPGVPSLVDLAHSTCSEQGRDLVGTETCSSGKSHKYLPGFASSLVVDTYYTDCPPGMQVRR